MRTRALLLFVVVPLVVAGCSASPGDGGAPGGEERQGFEGTYSVEFTEPTVAASVGFLSTSPSISEEGGRLSVQLDFTEPDTDGSQGLGSGIGISDELELSCILPDDCYSFGGAGRLVLDDGELLWDPEIALLDDDFIEGCDGSLVPPATVPLRDAVYDGDVLQAFTVDIVHLVNQAYGSSDPDHAAGPCSVAALLELEMTATRVD